MITGLNLINGTTFRLGVCIPSTCNPQEVENTINQSKYTLSIILLKHNNYII